jgi:hypothetical protein
MDEGRMITWTPELEDDVITAIESGDSLRQVAARNGFCAASILNHKDADAEFAKRYTRALQIRADSDFESLADAIAAEPERGKFGIDPGWANWQRTRIDTLKWMVAKRNPRVYGERVQQEHSGPDGGPLQFVTRSILDAKE